MQERGERTPPGRRSTSPRSGPQRRRREGRGWWKDPGPPPRPKPRRRRRRRRGGASAPRTGDRPALRDDGGEVDAAREGGGGRDADSEDSPLSGVSGRSGGGASCRASKGRRRGRRSRRSTRRRTWRWTVGHHRAAGGLRGDLSLATSWPTGKTSGSGGTSGKGTGEGIKGDEAKARTRRAGRDASSGSPALRRLDRQRSFVSSLTPPIETSTPRLRPSFPSRPQQRDERGHDERGDDEQDDPRGARQVELASCSSSSSSVLENPCDDPDRFDPPAPRALLPMPLRNSFLSTAAFSALAARRAQRLQPPVRHGAERGQVCPRSSGPRSSQGRLSHTARPPAEDDR